MKAVLVQHIFAPVRIVKGTRSVIRAGGKTQQRAYCGNNKRYGFFHIQIITYSARNRKSGAKF